MDHTLAYIIVPMLKQLKDTQHGAANTDDEVYDVFVAERLAEENEIVEINLEAEQ